jgi:hypothetical protein
MSGEQAGILYPAARTAARVSNQNQNSSLRYRSPASPTAIDVSTLDIDLTLHRRTTGQYLNERGFEDHMIESGIYATTYAMFVIHNAKMPIHPCAICLP